MDALLTAVTEIGKYLLAKIIEHIGYLFKYKKNVETLKVERDKLNAKRNDVNHFKDQTDRKFQDVSASTTDWLSEVNLLHQKAEEIISRDNVSCLNPCSRYSLSKYAWKLTQEINEKVKTAPDIGAAIDRPAGKLGDIFHLRGFVEFDSRLTVMNRVYEALKDEEVSMCSVCGMGGIGKTTLVKKLIQRVEDDHLFDKVVMVTVSQNPNFEKIQTSIIEQLGLGIKETDITARGKKLNAWLTSNKTLLVLDDVWWQLNDEDFEQVGIPLMSKRCKIVLTSRNEDECKKMGSQPTFPIKVLEDGEAWELFQLYAGECVKDLNIQSTARKIADECDGLPIAILTFATALKDKPKGVWDDLLQQLQNSNLLGISGMEKVYSRIQLSYDLLEDKEAQSCFLLCCLFPEDYDVSVERLVFYGKGLELFENVHTMKEARDRVEKIILKLKTSFLLLDGQKDGYIRMHDLARDFAISVSSKDKYPYLVRCEHKITKWPETTQCENCSAISLVCFTIGKHLIDLRCPKLELLQLNFKDNSSVLPDDLFEGMKELKVVDLRVSSALQPLTALKKLRTLLINYGEYYWMGEQPPNNIGDLLGDSGDLKNLEIFSYSTKVEVYDFPVKIGLLCNLRCLGFENVSFKYMPPGVLSKLVKLEELRLTWTFLGWGCQEEEGKRVNANLNEIKSLPLTTLSLSIPKGSILAEKLVESITRFQVCMGMYKGFGGFFSGFDAELIVDGADACDVTMSWMSCLLRKCKRLVLVKVRNLKNIMSLQSEEDNGFPQLKSLEIDKCYEMEYLANTTAEQIPSTFLSQLQLLDLSSLPRLKELWHGPCFPNIQASSFNVLIEITICQCPELKYVFPLSVAREMRQLQHMKIDSCDEMEEIIYNDQVDDINQVEPSVQLNAQAVETTTTPTLDHKPQHICPTPNSFIRGLLGKRKQAKDISSHKMMEENIVKIDEREVDGNAKLKMFPQLTTLKLGLMPMLRNFYDGNHAIQLPSLEELTIIKCDKMEALSYRSFHTTTLKKIQIDGIIYGARQNLFSDKVWEECEVSGDDAKANLTKMSWVMGGLVAKCESLMVEYVENLKWLLHSEQDNIFPLLKNIHLSYCHGMEYLVDTIAELKTLFTQLETLNMFNMDSLKEIWHASYSSKIEATCFSNLSVIHISFCPKLKYVFPLSVATELRQLQRMEISNCLEMEQVFYRDQVDDENDQVASGAELSTTPTTTLMNSTSNSIIPGLLGKGKQPKNISSHHQIVEENIAKDDGKEVDHAIIIIFPQLKHLILSGNRKLRIFYDGNEAIELPSLQGLRISYCDNMEGLSYGSLIAPKLKEIEINWETYQNWEDVNAIVKEKVCPYDESNGEFADNEEKEIQ